MLSCIKPAWLVSIPLSLLCPEENLTFEAFWKELLKKEKCFLASLSSWSHPRWIWNREGGGECVALVLRSFKLNVCNMEGSTCSSWGRVPGGVSRGACPGCAGKRFSAQFRFQVELRCTLACHNSLRGAAVWMTERQWFLGSHRSVWQSVLGTCSAQCISIIGDIRCSLKTSDTQRKTFAYLLRSSLANI